MPIQKQPNAMRFVAADIDGPRSGCETRPARAHGFTLIELLIVLAIVAILAAIAYPSYKNYVLKGKRAEGRGALVNLLQQEEAYITQNGYYLTFSAGDTTQTAFRVFSNDDSVTTTAAYKLGAKTCDGSTNTKPNDCIEVFTAPNNIVDPSISELNITSAGVKSCVESDSTVCWP